MDVRHQGIATLEDGSQHLQLQGLLLQFFRQLDLDLIHHLGYRPPQRPFQGGHGLGEVVAGGGGAQMGLHRAHGTGEARQSGVDTAVKALLHT